jgi:hypothetical protein
LVYGVAPEPWAVPADAGELLRNLARTPMKLTEVDRPRPLRRDWVIVRSRLTGICGSDAKQVFMDFGNTGGESPLMSLFTLPQVLGQGGVRLQPRRSTAARRTWPGCGAPKPVRARGRP